MSSLIQRDQLLRQCWVPAYLRVPDNHPHGIHYPVSVMGVIDDPRLRLNGQQAFVDIVTWWAGAKIWTVTHSCRADSDPTIDTAVDLKVVVTFWQPLLPLPMY